MRKKYSLTSMNAMLVCADLIFWGGNLKRKFTRSTPTYPIFYHLTKSKFNDSPAVKLCESDMHCYLEFNRFVIIFALKNSIKN